MLNQMLTATIATNKWRGIKEKLIFLNQKLFYFVFLRWLRILFWADIKNFKEFKKLDRPVVIIANHKSGWDPFILLSALGRKFFLKCVPFRLPTFYTFFKPVAQRWFLKSLGCYAITPTGNLEQSAADTLNFIKSGYNMVFFPEGKRVRKDEIAKSKKGISYLAKNASFYILPMYIDYSSYHKSGFGVEVGCKATIVMGEPVKSEYFVENFDEEVRHEAIMDLVWGLKEIEDFKAMLEKAQKKLEFKQFIMNFLQTSIRKSKLELQNRALKETPNKSLI